MNTASGFGICQLSAAPLRAEPGNRFEQVSTLLFGEHFKILEQIEKWIKISVFYDGYEGWLDYQQYLPITAQEVTVIESGNFSIAASPTFPIKQIASSNEGYDIAASEFSESLMILPGSILPGFKSGNFNMPDHIYNYQGRVFENKLRPFNELESIIPIYLNAPYHWGGRSPNGIDCSGLVQILYRMLGLKLPRDASQQVLAGEPISFLEESLPGDLVFFDNMEGRITHVGILIDNQRVLHASGWVRVDRIDHQGIYNSRLNCYSHKLRTIRRVIRTMN